MKTKILNLNKDYYENGRLSGVFFKNIIQENILKYKECIKNEEIFKKCIYILNKLKSKYPEYYEEIKGKASGAEVDFNAFFAMMCPEILGCDCHCTTIMCKKENGKFIISHNEDDDYIEGNFCISKVTTKDGWFATNDIYNMPFGNGFSWNSFGIIKTIDYCYDPNIIEENLPRYFSQRHISEARSIDDLVKRCNEIRPASGYHVNALDINNNIAVSIEVYKDSIDVEYITDYYIHSNHYIHSEYKSDSQIDDGSNSVFRLEKATELFEKIEERNLSNIKNILDYRDISDKFEYSIFQTTKDPYITGMNFSFDIDNKDIIKLFVYTNKEKLNLDYNLKI